MRAKRATFIFEFLRQNSTLESTDVILTIFGAKIEI